MGDRTSILQGTVVLMFIAKRGFSMLPAIGLAETLMITWKAITASVIVFSIE